MCKSSNKMEDLKSQPFERCVCLTYWLLLKFYLPNLSSAVTCFSGSFLLAPTPHCNPGRVPRFIQSESQYHHLPAGCCRCKQSKSHFRCFKEWQQWLILPTHTDYKHLETSSAIHHGVAQTAPAPGEYSATGAKIQQYLSFN